MNNPTHLCLGMGMLPGVTRDAPDIITTLQQMSKAMSINMAYDQLFAVAVKRARILKEGSLSLIPYGMDEKLRWAERIGHFTRQARFAAILLCLLSITHDGL